jgi:RNA polymerase sigma-70 factor (ECF subfamily)
MCSTHTTPPAFARLLQKDYLQAAAREKGRFRTFLLVASKRFLANEWDREHSQKRGGFAPEASMSVSSLLGWRAACSGLTRNLVA